MVRNLALFLLLVPAPAFAEVTYTNLLHLCKPGENDYDWLDCVNGNWDILDSSGVQTNASGLTTGTLPNGRLDPSSVTLLGPWIPAEKVLGTLPAGTSVQSYVPGSIHGQDIAGSTIPLSALNPQCAAGQTITIVGGKWACSTSLTIGDVVTATKYTFDFTDFATAGYSSSTLLAVLPAKTVLHDIVIKHSVSFSGGVLANYIISVGTGTVVPYDTYYTDGFDVNTAVATDNMQLTSGAISDNYTSSWPVYVTAKSNGDTLDQANQGSVDIWLYTSSLP